MGDGAGPRPVPQGHDNESHALRSPSGVEAIRVGVRPAAAGVEAEADTDPVALDPGQAQQLGIVANELIANAARHGSPPVHIELRAGAKTLLVVRDGGPGPDGRDERLGLQLVRQIVKHGLGGTFSLEGEPRGGTRAQVEIPANAGPGR